jgi:hypothetical protein
MHRDGHWMLIVIDDDDPAQGIEGGGTPGPEGQDLRQPIWSFGAVLPDCALDEFVNELGVIGADRVEELLHPLKAGRATGSQGVGEILSGQLAF